MALLEVKNLVKKFNQEEVLKGISFSLDKGEILAIIGPSGGGKSTLLRCLNYLETPDEGMIEVDGENYFRAKEKLSLKELRRRRKKFGLVFQSFNLFPNLSVISNIMLSPELNSSLSHQALEVQANKLLAQVRLADKAQAYPGELSGGQKQRAAIARALMLSPEVLCFDEPTSALDPLLTGEVLRVIKSLKGPDMTMIIVTHEMEFARQVADKIIFVNEGVIAASGKPEEIFVTQRSTNRALNEFLAGFGRKDESNA